MVWSKSGGVSQQPAQYSTPDSEASDYYYGSQPNSSQSDSVWHSYTAKNTNNLKTCPGSSNAKAYLQPCPIY